MKLIFYFYFLLILNSLFGKKSIRKHIKRHKKHINYPLLRFEENIKSLNENSLVNNTKINSNNQILPQKTLTKALLNNISSINNNNTIKNSTNNPIKIITKKNLSSIIKNSNITILNSSLNKTANISKYNLENSFDKTWDSTIIVKKISNFAKEDLKKNRQLEKINQNLVGKLNISLIIKI